MPELPEVELVARELRSNLIGCRLTGVRKSHSDVLRPAPRSGARELSGRTVVELRRRGKLLIFELDDNLVMTIHLRMTGRLEIVPSGRELRPHTHFIVGLDSGLELRFSDTRRFGRIQILKTSDLADDPFLKRLGPEPLGMDASALALRLARRRGTLKGALLDQSLVAGLGNIYVDEILHRAGLHPLLIAGRLRPKEMDSLASRMNVVLAEAIDAGGSTISDFRQVNGDAGSYQREHRVFGRQEEACGHCGSLIRKIVVCGRGTYFCPHCQPRRRGRMTMSRGGTK